MKFLEIFPLSLSLSMRQQSLTRICLAASSSHRLIRKLLCLGWAWHIYYQVCKVLLI